MQHLETAIRARAYALWVASGHAHGRDEQHWHQAEREIAEVEAQTAAVEVFTPAAVEAAPAKPARKKAAKAASPKSVEAAPAFVRKVRTPKQGSSAGSLN